MNLTDEKRKELGKALYKRFARVTIDGENNTKFLRTKVEFFLPQDLKQAFKGASKAGQKSMPYDDAHRQMVQFVRHQIYGRLPNYRDSATSEEAEGIIINGKQTQLMMDMNVAQRQIRVALKGLVSSEKDQLCSSVKRQYQPVVTAKSLSALDPVTSAVNLNNRPIYDRQLVALIIREVTKIKGESSPAP